MEIRERRNNGDAGDFMQICMGCKSTDACENMKAQNFQNENPDYTQAQFKICMKINSHACGFRYWLHCRVVSVKTINF